MGELTEFLAEFDPYPGVVMPSDWKVSHVAVRPDRLMVVNLRMLGPGVYLLMRQGVCLYVGSSRRLMKRLTEHYFCRKRPITFDQVKIILCAEKDLKACEKTAAIKFRPQLNYGTGWGREKMTFEDFGIDIIALIRENPAKIELRTQRASWRRI